MIRLRLTSGRRSTMSSSRLLVLTLVLAVLPLRLAAQTIVGKVTDAGGTPVAQVAVSVEGTNIGATTREDGTYRLAGVPQGIRVVVARRLGYSQQRRTVTVGTSELTVNIERSEERRVGKEGRSGVMRTQ